MTALSVAHPRPRLRSRLDHASLFLLKTVLVEDWRPEAAGRQLLEGVHDDRRVLELLRARVSRAMLGRTTRTDARAAATVDSALHLLGRRTAAMTISAQGGSSAG